MTLERQYNISNVNDDYNMNIIIWIITINFVSSAFSKPELQAALHKKPAVKLKSDYMALEKTVQRQKSNNGDNNSNKTKIIH